MPYTHVVSAGNGKVVRILKYAFACKIFGSAELIENLLAQQLRAEAGASAAHMNQWIAAGII